MTSKGTQQKILNGKLCFQMLEVYHERCLLKYHMIFLTIWQEQSQCNPYNHTCILYLLSFFLLLVELFYTNLSTQLYVHVCTLHVHLYIQCILRNVVHILGVPKLAT